MPLGGKYRIKRVVGGKQTKKKGSSCVRIESIVPEISNKEETYTMQQRHIVHGIVDGIS